MKQILVGNWKNYPESLSEARAIAVGLSKNAAVYKKLNTYVAPPLPYFETVQKGIKSFAKLASQDIFFGTEGTFTGVVTPDILKSFGVNLSIIGHSERRALGETNEIVSNKIKAALKSDITPLFCVGESEQDSDGNHFEFIREELRLSLEGIRRKDDASKLIIAYEPIWAIGKSAKDAIDPKELTEMIVFIRKVLSDIFGRESADNIPVLYGGSVKPNNAKILLQTGIDGFLVGGASLEPKDFCAIAKEMSS